eukprot:TRINITY_DN26730_c0_g1_i1.p1 TRINITY_DN26730_c0_g1~~TRINITY_DN26730_c0_g1_i1.p1  ORF type:complete len:531 (-),score=57.50 TRINITY_DN26730_c0_g1_i1:251-1843(-)
MRKRAATELTGEITLAPTAEESPNGLDDRSTLNSTTISKPRSTTSTSTPTTTSETTLVPPICASSDLELPNVNTVVEDPPPIREPHIFPQLPNELAHLCLARVPLPSWGHLRGVSSAWRRAMLEGDVIHERARMRLSSSLVVLLFSLALARRPGEDPFDLPEAAVEVRRKVLGVHVKWPSSPIGVRRSARLQAQEGSWACLVVDVDENTFWGVHLPFRVTCKNHAGVARKALTVVVDPHIYLLLGSVCEDCGTDFWRYDVLRGEWSRLASLPGSVPHGVLVDEKKILCLTPDFGVLQGGRSAFPALVAHVFDTLDGEAGWQRVGNETKEMGFGFYSMESVFCSFLYAKQMQIHLLAKEFDKETFLSVKDVLKRVFMKGIRLEGQEFETNPWKHTLCLEKKFFLLYCNKEGYHVALLLDVFQGLGSPESLLSNHSLSSPEHTLPPPLTSTYWQGHGMEAEEQAEEDELSRDGRLLVVGSRLFLLRQPTLSLQELVWDRQGQVTGRRCTSALTRAKRCFALPAASAVVGVLV